MTLLGHYRDSAPPVGERFDELTGTDGTIRDGWAWLDGLVELDVAELDRARGEVSRLLADHGVTYTPSPAGSVSLVDDRPDRSALTSSTNWRLDAVPLVLDDREFADLEAGLVQRAQVLEAVLADLYGPRRLLASGLLPAAAFFDHDEYLRPLVGSGTPRMFMTGLDLGRDRSGRWTALSDRTQAPSGAGYAMQNRRVLSRVLPDLFHRAKLARLTPFFNAMRVALMESAPQQVEDPCVVLLSPGSHSETAYDQAFLASLLGFPLVEGSDLVVRDGRVWMRVLDKLEQVDVIVRRVDSTWVDSLELRRGSELGVTGLVECVRRGRVSVVNAVGSGVLENPALLPYLPRLCEELLGESLRLPSVATWWCGDKASLSHVRANVESMVIRATSKSGGRSVRAAALSSGQLDTLLRRVAAAPHQYVGQELLDLSVAPSATSSGIASRTVVLRSFCVRQGDGFVAMAGGLASTGHLDSRTGVLLTSADRGASKDVWVVSRDRAPRQTVTVGGRFDALASPSRASLVSAGLVPRVLSDLYWMGRYAERAEDLLRLLLATSAIATDRRLDESAARAYSVALTSLTQVSRSYPGFLADDAVHGEELRALLLSRTRPGAVAASVLSLQLAAQGVRDQLSDDVWMVLAGIDRAIDDLARRQSSSWPDLTATGERLLTGLLALAGIVSENMVRDSGWYLLDSGRGLERALQVLRLLEVTLCQERPLEVDRQVIDTVLTASESIVTFRRRQRGRIGVGAVVDLLVIDPDNPRSVAYQLQRVFADLLKIPNASMRVAPIRLLDELVVRVGSLDPVALATPTQGFRHELARELAHLQSSLRELSDEIHTQWQQLPPAPKQLPPQYASALPSGWRGPGPLDLPGTDHGGRA